jgi:hypothetical protein
MTMKPYPPVADDINRMERRLKKWVRKTGLATDADVHILTCAAADVCDLEWLLIRGEDESVWWIEDNTVYANGTWIRMF